MEYSESNIRPTHRRIILVEITAGAGIELMKMQNRTRRARKVFIQAFLLSPFFIIFMHRFECGPSSKNGCSIAESVLKK